MQRLVAGLGRAPFLAAPLAVAAHPANPQNGAGHRLAVEETHDGFVNIGFEQPIMHHEVSGALVDLATLGGGHRAPTSASLPGPASAAPLIEEVDCESEASSEGSDLNAMIASFDSHSPHSPCFEPAGEGASAMDLLTASITNLLNNDAVVNAISSQLSRDPAFVALMDRFDAPNPGLPAPARMLLLEEVTGAGDAYPAPSGGEEGASPLVLLLQGIQRGVAVAAGRMGEAFCHLGNLLRGLGESLSGALAGMEGAATPAGGAVLEGAQRGAGNFHAAMGKVACAVAVLVLTRRMALARMVV